MNVYNLFVFMYDLYLRTSVPEAVVLSITLPWINLLPSILNWISSRLVYLHKRDRDQLTERTSTAHTPSGVKTQCGFTRKAFDEELEVYMNELGAQLVPRIM